MFPLQPIASTAVIAVSLRSNFALFDGIQNKQKPVAWYKIARWDFQNKATRTSPPCPASVLEVPLSATWVSACMILYHAIGSCKRHLV